MCILHFYQRDICTQPEQDCLLLISTNYKEHRMVDGIV